ncbi:MAG: DUF4296 domain-containing protein [Paludibacteraceae bacterium]|nr:DUF4296 domain-containing protein [Paludibacteraceae bacterium]
MKTTINKYFKLVLALSLVLYLSACKVDKGEPVIGKEKMCDILYDQYIVKAALQKTTLPDSVKKEYYYCNVLEKNGVTEALFDSALTWYTLNMDQYMIIQDSVIARLNKKKNEIENEK